MTVDIRNPQGQPLSTADRSNAVAESLKQVARVSRFVDRKKGLRSYQTHVKRDVVIPILFVVVFLIPSALGALYFGLIASDQFVTEARFALRPAMGNVEKASPDQVGTNGGGNTGLMVIQDSLVVASYIESRPMIEALEATIPVRQMFSRDSIDYLSRYNPERPIEWFVKYWNRRVAVEIESHSGIMSLSVRAFDAAESLALAQAILTESERMVNALSMKSREDAVAESTRELALAEERMTKIRVAVAALRNKEGVLDAQKTNESNLKVIGELRTARINLAVQLSLGMRDLGPESRRIQDIKSQIKDLDDNIARIEQQSASQDPERRRVLADALTRFESLDNDRKDAEKYYAKVLAAYERSRIMAARQVEFFTPVVQPVMAESSQQPRRILMTSLIVAGAGVAFALSVFARKQMT